MSYLVRKNRVGRVGLGALALTPTKTTSFMPSTTTVAPTKVVATTALPTTTAPLYTKTTTLAPAPLAPAPTKYGSTSLAPAPAPAYSAPLVSAPLISAPLVLPSLAPAPVKYVAPAPVQAPTAYVPASTLPVVAPLPLPLPVPFTPALPTSVTQIKPAYLEPAAPTAKATTYTPAYAKPVATAPASPPLLSLFAAAVAPVMQPAQVVEQGPAPTESLTPVAARPRAAIVDTGAGGGGVLPSLPRPSFAEAPALPSIAKAAPSSGAGKGALIVGAAALLFLLTRGD